MASADNFQASYEACEHYPRGRIYQCVHAGGEGQHRKRLDGLATRVLLPAQSDGATQILVWDVVEARPTIDATTIRSDTALRAHLGESSQSAPNAATTPTRFFNRADPGCRFIFLRSVNSRSHLLLTRRSLQRLFAFYQIAPAYLNFLSTFGQVEGPKDLVYSEFREETHLGAMPVVVWEPTLERSNQSLQLSYGLQGAYWKPSDHSWSVRPAAVHHQFDVGQGTMVWIMAQGNLDLYQAIKKLTGPAGREIDRDVRRVSTAFRVSLAVHLLVANWARGEWQGYIDSLAQKVKDVIKKVSLRGHNELDHMQSTEDQLNEAATALKGNMRCMKSLCAYYDALSQNSHFGPRTQCQPDIHKFLYELSNVVDDLNMEYERVSCHMKAVTDRKALIFQYLQAQQNDINRSLQLDSREIALDARREGIAISIITIVTLLYLPATVVSVSYWLFVRSEMSHLSANDKTVFGSGILNPQGSDTTWLLWIEITVPLTLLTLIIAGVGFYLRNDKKKRSREIQRIDLEKNG